MKLHVPVRAASGEASRLIPVRNHDPDDLHFGRFEMLPHEPGVTAIGWSDEQNQQRS